MFMRDDPDLYALVKIGRALNELTCELVNVETNKEQRTVNETRQYRHAGKALGGYVHETIQLVDRMKGRYLGIPAFEPLRVLVVEAEHRPFRYFVSTLRNCIAFHLDQQDEVTVETVSNLKPDNYTMMCGEGGSNVDYYFEFSEYIDLAFLSAKNPLEKSLKETADALVEYIATHALDLIIAAHTFQNYLWDKAAKQHVY
jgi:hypothetical protein